MNTKDKIEIIEAIIELHKIEGCLCYGLGNYPVSIGYYTDKKVSLQTEKILYKTPFEIYNNLNNIITGYEI